MDELAAVGLAVPEVLLPARGIDLARWAVVACDQYTSEPEYWKACEERVGAAPSTLRLILPEVWLGADDEDERVTAIQAAMREYLARRVLAPLSGFVLVDRATPHVALAAGPPRRARPRALRLAPRLARPRARHRGDRRGETPAAHARARGAALELPHVLVLIDDPQRTVIEPLASTARRVRPSTTRRSSPPAGRVRGFGVSDPAADRRRGARTARRAARGAPSRSCSRVGDGNHSLAAAKRCGSERKRESLEAQRARTPRASRWSSW